MIKVILPIYINRGMGKAFPYKIPRDQNLDSRQNPVLFFYQEFCCVPILHPFV